MAVNQALRWQPPCMARSLPLPAPLPCPSHPPLPPCLSHLRRHREAARRDQGAVGAVLALADGGRQGGARHNVRRRGLALNARVVPGGRGTGGSMWVSEKGWRSRVDASTCAHNVASAASDCNGAHAMGRMQWAPHACAPASPAGTGQVPTPAPVEGIVNLAGAVQVRRQLHRKGALALVHAAAQGWPEAHDRGHGVRQPAAHGARHAARARQLLHPIHCCSGRAAATCPPGVQALEACEAGSCDRGRQDAAARGSGTWGRPPSVGKSSGHTQQPGAPGAETASAPHLPPFPHLSATTAAPGAGVLPSWLTIRKAV